MGSPTPPNVTSTAPSSTEAPSTEASSTDPGAPSGSVGSSGSVGPQTVVLGSQAWLAGFQFQIKTAAYDPDTQIVTVGALVSNTAEADTPLSAILPEVLLDPKDGSALLAARSVAPSTSIIGGTTATASFVFRSAEGFSLDKAQLVLGTPAHHQWLVPLQAGATASGEKPVRLRVPATLRTASNLYYVMTSAQLLPWSCASTAPRTAYIPGAKSISVIALNGTLGAGELSVHASGVTSMYIKAPDGTTAAVTTLPLVPVLSNQSYPNELLCLPVPSHLPGVYTITITDYEHHVATSKITVP
ncbi:hypothetical protein BH10ACT8_BH10ACT8_32790 [soil metagenome]